MNKEKDFLEKEPVGKLLFKLAFPTVAAQLINMPVSYTHLFKWEKTIR